MEYGANTGLCQGKLGFQFEVAETPKTIDSLQLNRVQASIDRRKPWCILTSHSVYFGRDD